MTRNQRKCIFIPLGIYITVTVTIGMFKNPHRTNTENFLKIVNYLTWNFK